MENNNINLFKMRIDLSAIPEDIMPTIAKYLLKVDNTYKFNKIFRKRNDNKLLKYFFGNDENIFRYVNNFISYDYKIECKEINIEPIMDYINECFNTKITKIKILYSLDDIYGEYVCVSLYDNFKFYDKNNIKINILKVMSDWETNKQTRNKQYMISRLIDKMNIDEQLTEYNRKIKSTFLNILE
jgi:hypothetical protein